jgi:hypothetical protein
VDTSKLCSRALSLHSTHPSPTSLLGRTYRRSLDLPARLPAILNLLLFVSLEGRFWLSFYAHRLCLETPIGDWTAGSCAHGSVGDECDSSYGNDAEELTFSKLVALEVRYRIAFVSVSVSYEHFASRLMQFSHDGASSTHCNQSVSNMRTL